jgi:hypothetical protein
MHPQRSSTGTSIGCGFAGCTGGLILGLLGGFLLVVLVSLGQAITSPIIPPTSNDNPDPDLRLMLHEGFFNRVIQNSLGDAARVDILPDNQLSISTEVQVAILGISRSVPVTGLFELQLIGQSVEIRLIDTEVFGFDLPLELTDFFGDDLLRFNQDLNMALQEVSTILAAPIILTGIDSDESSLWFEARETQ